jgi:hypothetical protein
MTWPKEGNLSSEIEQLLNQRIQSYIDENKSENGGEDAQAVQKLIIDLYLIYKEADSPSDKFNLQQEIIHKGASWDTEDPALAQNQKYVNRVLLGQHHTATQYLSNAIDHKIQIEKTSGASHLSKLSQAGGNAKHAANNIVKAKALDHFQKIGIFTKQKKMQLLILKGFSLHFHGKHILAY